MKQKKKQDQYTVYERHGQLVLALNSEIMLPENAPVRLLSAQLEELEYGKLYEAYSSKGRKSAAEPRVLFKVLVHGYLCGIYSSRKLEEACQYRMTSDGCWRTEKLRTTAHWPGSARGAARKQWRTCSTSLSASWRKRGKQTTKRCSWTAPSWKAVRDGTPLCGGKAWKNSWPG